MGLQTLVAVLALLVSAVSLGGTALRVHGKWDTTNSLLRSLIREVGLNEEQHQQAHARMDHRTDIIDARLIDHIGRHRRV